MLFFRFAWVATAALIVTAVLLPAHMIARWLRHPIRKNIERRWHRAICKILGIKVEVRGSMVQPSGHGVLIAANHISWLDIIVLGSVAPISFVAKDEVKDWAIFGTLAVWQESVFIDRTTRLGAKAQAEIINKRLLDGDNIVLFPEGTTSDGNFIYPFKSSLFGALGVGAAAISSPIQPVSVAYNKLCGLPMGRFKRPLAAWPGDIEIVPHLIGVISEPHLGVVVSFGEPVEQCEGMNRKEITQIVQERVAEMTSLALRGR
ncbi:1-acyl-sn-glycerol-3-phosphate acyltransferase [Ahrensia sp. 13_GOM-1096m]|uniref:lysophospholipid acyltransferase family protein n=1 Tax=Ahrensia sp. 13_GOM-1096m TaxID=1380380 RepID=UPI000687B7DA|nr:lysophospholipid acyltransferase family protein [Ahrensia sp. 13_GOM-1096m]